jgi:hypothetical protein
VSARGGRDSGNGRECHRRQHLGGRRERRHRREPLPRAAAGRGQQLQRDQWHLHDAHGANHTDDTEHTRRRRSDELARRWERMPRRATLRGCSLRRRQLDCKYDTTFCQCPRGMWLCNESVDPSCPVEPPTPTACARGALTATTSTSSASATAAAGTAKRTTDIVPQPELGAVGLGRGWTSPMLSQLRGGGVQRRHASLHAA